MNMIVNMSLVVSEQLLHDGLPSDFQRILLWIRTSVKPSTQSLGVPLSARTDLSVPVADYPSAKQSDRNQLDAVVLTWSDFHISSTDCNFFSPTEGGEVINKACVLQMIVRAWLRLCAAALKCTQSGLCRWIDWGLPTIDTPMGEGTYLSIPALRPAPECSLEQNQSVLHFCATRRRNGDKIKMTKYKLLTTSGLKASTLEIWRCCICTPGGLFINIPLPPF